MQRSEKVTALLVLARYLEVLEPLRHLDDDRPDLLLAERDARLRARREQARERHAARALDVIVEAAVLVTILGKQRHRLRRLKVLKLQ